jgi:hypothetical protein
LLPPVCTRNPVWGRCALNERSACGMNDGATVGSTPMRNGASSGAPTTLSIARPNASTLVLAWRKKSSASGVSVAPLRPRTKSDVPSISSSSLSVLVTAGWVIASACAARRRLPCCATARKHCRWRSRMRLSVWSRRAGGSGIA